MAPFADAVILCPSHLVNGGWVVQLKDARVLHVREAENSFESNKDRVVKWFNYTWKKMTDLDNHIDE